MHALDEVDDVPVARHPEHTPDGQPRGGVLLEGAATGEAGTDDLLDRNRGRTAATSIVTRDWRSPYPLALAVPYLGYPTALLLAALAAALVEGRRDPAPVGER